jgi:hypothetical protein
MKDDNAKWYRTGAVAKMLGSSPHKIRELARVGLIESQLRNGYRYIPEHALARLRDEGLPPMPASMDLGETAAQEDHQADGTERLGARPAARTRLTQELFAEPSPQLAHSKERVIRLQHAVEAKRLQQQSRDIDNAAKAERARAQEAQRVQSWRDGNIRRAVERVPAELCADVCSRIEDLLNRVPACANVTTKVDEIIDSSLRPIRRREEQERALVAHRTRIADAVRRISLPYAGTRDEWAEAGELALTALGQSLPVEATDRQLQNAMDEAIRPIVERIKRRQAEKERRDQETAHKCEIERIVAWLGLTMPYGANQEDTAQAEQRVRLALERLPLTADSTAMWAARDREIAPIKAAIEQRREAQRQKEATERDQKRQQRETENDQERQRLQAASRLDSLLSDAVERRLLKLERDTIEFESDSDLYDLRDKVTRKIRPILIREIVQAPATSEKQLRERIAHLVDAHHGQFCEED